MFEPYDCYALDAANFRHAPPIRLKDIVSFNQMDYAGRDITLAGILLQFKEDTSYTDVVLWVLPGDKSGNMTLHYTHPPIAADQTFQYFNYKPEVVNVFKKEAAEVAEADPEAIVVPCGLPLPKIRIDQYLMRLQEAHQGFMKGLDKAYLDSLRLPPAPPEVKEAAA